MADNVSFQATTLATPAANTNVSTEEVTTLNGGAVAAQHVQRVAVSLRTADGTAIDLPGDAGNGLDVDVTRVSGNVATINAASSQADGHSLSLGATTDAAAGTDTANASLLSLVKRLLQRLTTLLPQSGGRLDVNVGAATTLTVNGSVEVANDVGNPLPINGTVTANLGTIGTAATEAKQDTGNTSLGSILAVEGATTDAAIISDANGSFSGKLRGLVKWAFERMPAALGQGTMAQSLPVVLPSNQTAIPVSQTSLTPGTGAANLGKAEDAVHADGDVGVMALAVRKDTATQLAGTDGDYSPLITDANGRLHVVQSAATVGGASSLPAGTNAIGKLAANDGVDVGDVTINNAAGASAVNIQDGGNSITVDALTGASALQVQGTAAHDAAVAGNPILNGAYASAAAPTAVDADGDAVRLWADRNGRLQIGDGAGNLSIDINGTVPGLDNTNEIKVSIYGTGAAAGDTAVSAGTISADSNTVTAALAIYGFPLLFNGSTWDRQRNNFVTTALSSAARTTTTNSSDITNFNGRGIILIVNVTSAGTGSISPSVQIKDSISASYFTIWTAAAALVANGTYAYALYPGAASTASWTEVAQSVLHRTIRIASVHNNANSITYSISVVLFV